jgi:hypothetical protein
MPDEGDLTAGPPNVPIESDDYGHVQFYTYAQKLRIHPDHIGKAITVHSHAPTDYTALIAVGIEDGDTVVIKDDGEHYRGIDLGTYRSTVRAREVSNIPYFYVLDKYAIASISGQLLKHRPVYKYSRWAQPEMVLNFTWPRDEDYEDWVIKPEIPSSPATDAYVPAMDVDINGDAWIAFTDSNGESWFCENDGNSAWINVTGFCESFKILAIAYDSTRYEWHFCLEDTVKNFTKVKVYGTTFTYEIPYGYVTTYQYSSRADGFFATIYTTADDLTSQPIGWQFYGPTGQATGVPVNFNHPTESDYRIKDIYGHDDEYCYLAYTDDSDNIVIARTHQENIFSGNLATSNSSLRTISSNIGTAADAERVSVAIISAAPISFTQII